MSTTPFRVLEARRMVARIAARHLDALPITDRIMVCEGIASLYPKESKEAITARQHADDLRSIDHQQLLLTELLES